MEWKTHRRVAAAALLILAFSALACSPVARHRVLNFFFDGVPGGKGDAVKAERPPSLFHPTAAPLTTPRPTPPPIVSVHKPWAERQCRVCHESEGRFVPISLDEKLCDRCHREQREREGWSHGPINLGTCVPCHRPHDSPYPRLLELPVPELCLICHREDLARQEKHHEVPNIRDCIACHDPHRMY